MYLFLIYIIIIKTDTFDVSTWNMALPHFNIFIYVHISFHLTYLHNFVLEDLDYIIDLLENCAFVRAC